MKNAKLVKLFSVALMLLVSNAGFSQDPGGNPDGPPPAVPFSDYMHILLIIAGAIFSFWVIKRLKRKEA